MIEKVHRSNGNVNNFISKCRYIPLLGSIPGTGEHVRECMAREAAGIINCRRVLVSLSSH